MLPNNKRSLDTASLGNSRSVRPFVVPTIFNFSSGNDLLASFLGKTPSIILERVPVDMLRHTFEYLKARDLFACYFVCKQFRSALLMGHTNFYRAACDILGNQLKDLSIMATRLFIFGKLNVTVDLNRFQQVYGTGEDDCILKDAHEMHISFENGVFCVNAKHNGTFWIKKYKYYEISRTVKTYSSELRRDALSIFGINVLKGRSSLSDFAFLIK